MAAADPSVELMAVSGGFAGWSPDGRQVLIVRPTNAGTELLRAPIDGGEVVSVAAVSSSSAAIPAAWQPAFALP